MSGAGGERRSGESEGKREERSCLRAPGASHSLALCLSSAPRQPAAAAGPCDGRDGVFSVGLPFRFLLLQGFRQRQKLKTETETKAEKHMPHRETENSSQNIEREPHGEGSGREAGEKSGVRGRVGS